MGFSSIIGASSVIRPGVCTSTTRPASPYDGQVIYETNTRQTLVYNGSGWVMLTDADTPPGLQLIKTQTIGTAVSNVTVTDAFSADFENYRIIVSGGTVSTAGSSNLTFGSTATGYTYSFMYVPYNSSTVTGGNATNTTSIAEAMCGTTNGVDTSIEVRRPFLTERTSVTWFWSGSNTGTNGNMIYGGGFVDNATSYTAFTLTKASGTITGGTIRVYGYRNS